MASSWPLLTSFWPFPGLSKISNIQGPQRRHFLFIKHCVSSSFSRNSGFLAFWCLFSNISYSSGPLLGLFWPLPVLFWPLFGPKISKIQGLPETSFSVHKTLRFEQFFPKFWITGLLGLFCQKPCIPGRLRSVRTCSFPSIAPGPR